MIVGASVFGQDRGRAVSSSYLFVWAGDADRKDTDFLTVIDIRPNQKRYGRIVTTLPVGSKNNVPHHTEHEMPAGSILFANGFGSGNTFRFDLSRPTKPKLLDRFGAAGEYMHPHSFVRYANGNVIATFQTRGHGNSEPGALAEIDPKGRVLRITDAADPKIEKFIRPYSLAVVPLMDRIVTSSADMEAKDISHVVQIWRYSDLKLIKSIYLQGPHGVDPAEPRLLSDGKTVLVSTFSCGLYRITDLATDEPKAEFVYTFGGENCALPVVAGNFWVATVPDSHALVSLDITDPAKPVEVSRLTMGENDKPHWISLEPNGDRVVMSGGNGDLESRIQIVRINKKTGNLAWDETFREKGSKERGISFDREKWPHGNNGRAIPHGAVFSRP
jgi:hypothetical protein